MHRTMRTAMPMTRAISLTHAGRCRPKSALARERSTLVWGSGGSERMKGLTDM